MKLIDKDVLTEKLWERRVKNRDFGGSPYSEYGHEDDEILSLINDLEVREVDFGTEIYKYIDEHFNVYDDGNQTLQTKDKKSLISRVDVENIAKYFYSLGLKAQKGE